MYNYFEVSSFPSLFTLIFILMAFYIMIQIFQNLKQWHQNNEAPRLNVKAKIVDKHIHTTTHHHHHAEDHLMYTTTSNTYYVTFEVESGDRMTFKVKHTQYNMLVKGDQGQLQFQGSRYLNFERSPL